MTKLRLGALGADGVCRMQSTTRTSWMANKAIPDSITMNMICRSLVPPVEAKVRPTELALTSKNTLRILNTIKPVTRAFTAMDKEKLVIEAGCSHVAEDRPSACTSSCILVLVAARQVARLDKLKSDLSYYDQK